MGLAAGTRLGAYEIVGLIGAGGMGEVYRARDTRLDRDVAVKILPDLAAADPERITRFHREAKTLASLNHPNIGAIHGIEESGLTIALVLELVEGPTLADRIAQGALPLDEAMTIAGQVADALAAAHEHGIVHRDLKPANIKLRPDGTVKVLDFGLAKSVAMPAAQSGVSLSPTLTSPLGTQIGIVLGTAAYMAPEQARGRPIDRRADVWAFGCVLFEMVTGRRAFEGDEVTDVLASIVKSDPDWTLLPSGVPTNVRFLLERCLEKDRQKRLQDAGDIRVLLDSPLPTPAAIAAGRARSRTWPIAIGAAILASAIAGGAVWMLRGAEAKPITRFAIDLPEGQVLPPIDRHLVALSPNGRYLVYGTGQRLYLRSMDQIEATPIRGTEGGLADFGREPFFSPDSQWIGFWQGGWLKKVAVTGGAPVPLCEATTPTGAMWGADGTIVFGQGTRGIWQVSGTGGPPTPLIVFDEKDALTAHGPQVLPGTRSVLFTQKPAGSSSWNNASIVVHDLATGTRRVVVEGTDARYLSTGHLVYYRDGGILAVVFDLRRLAPNGGPVRLTEGVRGSGQQILGGVFSGGSAGAGQFALSDTGLLAYVPDLTAAEAEGSGIARTLVWVDRGGKEEPVAGAPVRSYVYPRLSPDAGGSRVALDIRDQQRDIWTFDFARRNLARVTRNPAADVGPVWSPDGKRIVFSSGRTGSSDLYWQNADGSGEAELLHGSKILMVPNSISPDNTLVFAQDTGTGNRDLMTIRLNSEQKAEPLIASPSTEMNGAVSPDGQWLAIQQSDESSQTEVWLLPFPATGAARTQVSNGGGTRPAWARSGRELFYMVAPPGATIVSMMAVPVQTSPSLVLGTPVKLFEGRYFSQLAGRTYDVSPDGKRFLMIKDVSPAQGSIEQRILIVQNWQEELKRRVPTR